jgi:hypothetical protein
MSNIPNILKKLTDIRRKGDPTIGLQYNNFNTHIGISSHIYSVDIARTPRIVSNDLEFIDVMAKVYKINSCARYVNLKMRNFTGGTLV